jgi:hypothetical protein
MHRDRCRVYCVNLIDSAAAGKHLTGFGRKSGVNGSRQVQRKIPSFPRRKGRPPLFPSITAPGMIQLQYSNAFQWTHQCENRDLPRCESTVFESSSCSAPGNHERSRSHEQDSESRASRRSLCADHRSPVSSSVLDRRRRAALHGDGASTTSANHARRSGRGHCHVV